VDYVNLDLTKLRQRLDISAALYQSENLSDHRRAVSNALDAVVEFLEAREFPYEALAPILRPMLALAERESNNIDQMFAERPRTGRPKVTMDHHDRTGILAAFANAWLRLHKDDDSTQSVKLTHAATKMQGGWFHNVTRANLATAREIVSQEAKNHPAVVVSKMFDEFFEQAIASKGRHNAFRSMVDYVKTSEASRIRGIWKTPPVSPDSSD
jgi:hypothetical protein